jgi:hypothetical protein
MNTVQKVPAWFWIVSIVALIWNLMGVMAYLGQALMSDEMKMSMPEAEMQLLEATPAWATAAFAIAVWGGLLGSLFLLLRKRQALAILVISFIGIIVQMLYNFFISNAMEVYGPGGATMPIMVLLIGIGLILFAKKGKREGWLR